MSIVGVMITNGGTHPPEKWAAMTASQIIQVSQNATDLSAALGRRMELKILDILEEVHTNVQRAEKDAIANIGADHLLTSLDPSSYVEQPVQAIVDAAKGTPYEAHFASENIKDYMRRLLQQHFGSAMHIERKTFCDTIPDHPAAQAYVQKYGNGVALA